MIEVGQEIWCHPITFYPIDMEAEGNKYNKAPHNRPPIKGIVTFIHPQRRFFTAEFKIGDNFVKESFVMTDQDGRGAQQSE